MNIAYYLYFFILNSLLSFDTYITIMIKLNYIPKIKIKGAWPLS